MEELKESVLALDTLRRDIPRYEDDPEPVISLREQRNGHQKQEQARKRAKAYHVSAAAVNAIRQIQEHFVFEEAPYGQMDFNEVNAAGIVDVCTNVYRVQDALNRMCAIVRHLNPHEMQRNMEMVRAALKALDIAVMRMPGFQPPTTRLRKVKEGPGLVAELSHEQKRNRQQVSLALSRARTPEEAQQVLNNARSDNLL